MDDFFTVLVGGTSSSSVSGSVPWYVRQLRAPRLLYFVMTDARDNVRTVFFIILFSASSFSLSLFPLLYHQTLSLPGDHVV